jgi:hypothetical protein
MPWAQLLNSRSGITYSHPTELMAELRIFARALRFIARAAACVNFRPMFCRGASGASDDVGRAIFPVT